MARITRGEEVFELKANESTYKTLHRFENCTELPLKSLRFNRAIISVKMILFVSMIFMADTFNYRKFRYEAINLL